jgi:hypothetical protein
MVWYHEHMNKNFIGKNTACRIGCMDARINHEKQGSPVAYMRDYFDLDFVDNITMAGAVGEINKFMDTKNPSSDLKHKIEHMFEQLEVSIQKHGTKIICVDGHHDCAANQVDDKAQMGQIIRAIHWLRDWAKNKGYKLDVIGLWVGESMHVERAFMPKTVIQNKNSIFDRAFQNLPQKIKDTALKHLFTEVRDIDHAHESDDEKLFTKNIEYNENDRELEQKIDALEDAAAAIKNELYKLKSEKFKRENHGLDFATYLSSKFASLERPFVINHDLEK